MRIFVGPTIASRCHGHDNHFNLIRLCAALAVVASHGWLVTLGPQAVEPLADLLHGKSLGRVAVAAFFAISGFFIAMSFERRRSIWSFASARVLRIFPGLLVMLCATVIAASFLTTADGSTFWSSGLGYIGWNLSLFAPQYGLAGVFDANPHGTEINASLWSLSFEVVCYLSVVILGLAGILGNRLRFGFAYAGFMIGYLMPLAAGHPFPAGTLFFPFSIGVAFWVWRDRVVLSPAALAAVWCLAALLHPTVLFEPVLNIAIAYTAFCVGFAQFPVFAGFNRFGDYSYGAYIYAFPIQQGLVHFGVLSPIWNVVLAVPLVMLCAVLSWHLVEAPALRLKQMRFQWGRVSHQPAE